MGMNICREVMLEHSNAAPYIVQQTQGVAAAMLLET